MRPSWETEAPVDAASSRSKSLLYNFRRRNIQRGGEPLYEDAVKKFFGKAFKPFSVACRNRVGPCLQVES